MHNLDSQVEDNTVSAVYDAYEWVLDVHDALILCCEATDYAKDVFCQGNSPQEPSLNRIYKERKTILGKYFKSIGINASAMKDWKSDVESHIIKYDKAFNCNRIVLKWEQLYQYHQMKSLSIGLGDVNISKYSVFILILGSS